MGCKISRCTETSQDFLKIRPKKNKKVDRRISKSQNKTQIDEKEQEALDQAKQLIKFKQIQDQDVEFQPTKALDVKDLRSQANTVKNFDIFQKKIQEISGQNFTDDEFPPNQKSLTRDLSYMQEAEQYKWTRAQDIYPDKQVQIFQGKIEPNDIKQGALGDCYFLSALSVLAERENLIEKLFVSKEVNKEGVYGIVMCIDGEFQEILVDDWIPTTKDGKICFSRSNQKDLDKFGFELWVLLLEKAYAKVYKGYNQIVSGLTGNAIRDLTGAPAVYLECKNGPDEMWDFLKYHELKGHMLTAGTTKLENQTEEQDTGKGIVSGHAYAILQVREVERSGVERIIQLRNPWGKKEWSGDWSDKSSKWTEELKRQLNFTDEDDGIFWIKVEDFVKQFHYVTANYVKESYQYDSIKIPTKKNHSILLKFNVKEDDTHAFLEITQKDQRHFEPKDKYNYRYARILCCSGDFQEWIGDNEGKERNIPLEGTFKKGTYIAWIDISDQHKKFDADYITVSSYSDKQVQFSQQYEYKKENELQILDQMLICQPSQNEELVKIFDEDDKIARYQGQAGGYIYFQLVNNSTKGSIYKSIIQMVGTQNLQIMHPYTSNKEVKIKLKPKEVKIVKYTVKDNNKQAQKYRFKYLEIIEEGYDQLVQKAKEQSKSDRKQRYHSQIYFTQFTFKGGYLKPGEDQVIMLKQKDFSKGYSFQTKSSYKIY